MFQTHLDLEQLVGRAEVKFDVRRFNWLGSQETGQMMLYIRADSPYKSIDDMRPRQLPRLQIVKPIRRRADDHRKRLAGIKVRLRECPFKVQGVQG